MRIPLSCMKCFQEDGKPTGIIELADVQDSSCYQLNCPRGHKTYVVVQEQKFEVLFGIGSYAIRDGYYREAVSSFTSSLERFYEFFVRAALIEAGLSVEAIDEAWRTVARQSERQLGAFVFTYVRDFQRTPRLMPRQAVEFRNDVIHQGMIPTRSQAIEYGQHALDLLRLGISNAAARYPKAIKTLTLNGIRIGYAVAREAGADAVATASIPTVVNLTHAQPEESLETALGTLPRWIPLS